MNKDKLEVGDLVNHTMYTFRGIGLVVKKLKQPVTGPGKYLYNVYWFSKGYSTLHSKYAIVKCTEEPNE